MEPSITSSTSGVALVNVMVYITSFSTNMYTSMLCSSIVQLMDIKSRSPKVTRRPSFSSVSPCDSCAL